MKNKQSDHLSIIISKRHGVFTDNLFTIFFSNAGRTGIVPKFEFSQILGDHLLKMI